MTLLQRAALDYLRAGWSLIPLKPNGKEPLIPWTEFQQRKATESEVNQWFSNYPSMNLGLVTGKISGIAAMDFDGSNGEQFAEAHNLTSPLVVLTGNGKQVYYQWQEGITNSASKIAPGVDVRGEGGYVVLPPSIHPSGKRYRWCGLSPKMNVVMELPSFPTGFIGVDAESTAVISTNGYSRLDIAKSLEEMKHGNIDSTLVSILGRLRRDGFSSEDARVLLAPHATKAGATPGHLEDKIEHIWSKYEPVEKRAVEQHLHLSENRAVGGLVIHSPTNPDSIKLYNERTETINDNNIRSGFSKLDAMLEGGFKSERLFTVAARTGTGKTNFAIALSRSFVDGGRRVLFFSTEFSFKKIWDRFTLNGTKPFKGEPFYVCDSFTPNLSQIEEAIREVKPDVFIFDHINHLGEERETLGMFMQGCNFLQRKYNTQGIMVAQLNRQADWVENGQRITPRMSMIKGSGTIEQASSRVLLLSETKILPEYNEIVGVLDKNDSGDKGILQFGLYKNPYFIKEI